MQLPKKKIRKEIGHLRRRERGLCVERCCDGKEVSIGLQGRKGEKGKQVLGVRRGDLKEGKVAKGRLQPAEAVTKRILRLHYLRRVSA